MRPPRAGESMSSRGFTLIELMVVILIIGVMATFVTLSIGNRALDDRMDTESHRIEELTKLALDEADLKGIPLGLSFGPDGYRFLAINEKKLWSDYGGSDVFRARKLSAPFFVNLTVENRPVGPAAADTPADKIVPPVKGPLSDAARALQFVRSKAGEWNLDKARIGASGGSAGACSSLWLAFHPDLADPKSEDPIARESTRLWCAAVSGPQTTLDPQQMKEWTPNSRYGGHAFGFTGNKEKKQSQFEEFLAGREKILPWIAEYSPYALVSADDPPVYLSFGAPPALGQDQKDPTHTSNFGVKLQEHCKALGVPCELVYPGAPDVQHPSIAAYLVAKLKAPTQR